MQVITYNEFLPALLGRNALPRYRGYDAAVDASIANEFSTACYRLGHSMLSPQIQLVDARGEIVDILALKDAFFNRGFYEDDPRNLDYVLRGLALQKMQEIDSKVVDDVRNFLFGPPRKGGMDKNCRS